MSLVKRYSKQLIGFAGFSSLLVLWQLAGFLNILPKFVLPTPLEIGTAFVRDRALLLHHSLSTLQVALIGLVIGVLLAAGFAILMDSFQWVNDLVYPFMVVIQTIPTIALAPILVLWFGYGMLPKLVLIIITVVFPIVVSFLDGFRHCDQDILRLFQIMQANRFQTLVHYKIPAALPYFFAGLRVSVSYAFISTVVSEWLGGFDGLGVYMIQSKKLFQYDTMFAIIVLISAISLLGMFLVDQLEKNILKWKKD